MPSHERPSSSGKPMAHTPNSPANRDDLRLRIASSVILVPGALAAVWFGGPVFAGVIAAAGVILAQEWTRMTDPEGPDLVFALTAGAAAGGVIAASAQQTSLAVVWVCAVAAVSAGVFWRRSKALEAAFGCLYIGGPCIALVWLRLHPDPTGMQMTIVLFAAVWGADIGAYAAGRVLKGPRLAPTISENKTWAGLAGGLVLASLAGAIAAGASGWPTTLVLGGVAGVCLGACGLSGDLLESAIKRRYGVKDTGALIPGHGGLLDRVDGLMIAALGLALAVGAGRVSALHMAPGGG